MAEVSLEILQILEELELHQFTLRETRRTNRFNVE